MEKWIYKMNGYLTNTLYKHTLYTVVKHWVAELKISQRKVQIHIIHHMGFLVARLHNIRLISTTYTHKLNILTNFRKNLTVIMDKPTKNKRRAILQSSTSKKRVCCREYWKTNLEDFIPFLMLDTTTCVKQKSISEN